MYIYKTEHVPCALQVVTNLPIRQWRQLNIICNMHKWTS